MKWFDRLVRRIWSDRCLEITLEDLAQVWLPFNEKVERGQPRGQPDDGMESLVRPAVVKEGGGDKDALDDQAGEDKRPGEGPPGQGQLTPGFTDEVAGNPSRLVEEFLVPYRTLLERQGVWDGLLRVAGLLDHYGDCPSVVMIDSDSDREASQELYSLKETLAKVTLRDHTALVATLVIQELKQRYRDPDLLIPKMLIVALGHDLGKIPAFRGSGLYTKKDHPEISVVKVREAFDGAAVPWFEHAVELIRTHHEWTADELGGLFKLMDGKARELEIVRMTKTLQVKRWEEWFSVEGLITRLADDVNAVDRRGKWQAFSFGATVFCLPDAIWSATRSLARDQQVIDIHLVRDADQELVLRRVVNSLRAAEGLAFPIGDGYYGRKFRIHGPATRRKTSKTSNFYLIPLKLSLFQDAARDFEQRKEGYLEVIQDVELVA